MKGKHVVVLPYDGRWKTDFENIQKELNAALGVCAVRIEHVGSTAVEGLSAKPVIDIDVVIRDWSVLETAIEKLATAGYTYKGNLGIAGREAFCYTGKEHLRQHHLYVCAQDSAELKRHTVFRDFLRTHPEAREEYGHVKEKAAALFPYDIESYMKHKTSCIEKWYRRCGLRR